MPSQDRMFRVGLVALLLVGAFFVALPWLGCISYASISPSMLGVCTFGLSYPGVVPGPQPSGFPGFNGPYFGNLILGIVYVVAAAFVTFTKRL